MYSLLYAYEILDVLRLTILVIQRCISDTGHDVSGIVDLLNFIVFVLSKERFKLFETQDTFIAVTEKNVVYRKTI